jgi:hypothetical protein
MEWRRQKPSQRGHQPDGQSAGERTSGRPTSANGASSFHLWAEPNLDPADLGMVEVRATLEVVVAPEADELYFWALQASFLDPSGRSRGAGHLGLQWLPGGVRAANWGGYRDPSDGGGELDGTTSGLPAHQGNVNTRLYPWEPGRAYQLRIGPAPDAGSWRGSLTDLLSGDTQVVRDLSCGGSHLGSLVMWSEVFAPCDAPSVVVAWRDVAGTRPDGSVAALSSFRVTYQPHSDGGCANTTVRSEGSRILQLTNSSRQVAHGAIVRSG